MKLNKPKFWDKKNSIVSFFLFPLSFLTKLIIFLKSKLNQEIAFNIPVICVGNIYIGGTGKTPFSIFAANEMVNLGFKTAIIRKHYRSHLDEYNLIKKYFKSLIIKKDRYDAIKQAETEGFKAVVLDDGFQDIKIKKEINIICFNSNQLIGNGLIFPAGPLREDLTSLKRAQVVIINGKKNEVFEKKVLEINKDICFYYSYYKPLNLDQFTNKKLIALTGIGNPENFFDLLISNKLNIVEKIVYPDHYKFSKPEILNILNKAKKEGCELIMTEKDYLRIKDYNLIEIKYLKVELILKKKDDFINKFLRK